MSELPGTEYQQVYQNPDGHAVFNTEAIYNPESNEAGLLMRFRIIDDDNKDMVPAFEVALPVDQCLEISMGILKSAIASAAIYEHGRPEREN